jgi:hypothetical protein
VNDIFCEKPGRTAPLEVRDGVARSLQCHEDVVPATRTLNLGSNAGIVSRPPPTPIRAHSRQRSNGEDYAR